MKKGISVLLITLLILSGIMLTPSKSFAYNDSDTVDPIRNVFIDTLYGMAIGSVLAIAFSAAKGDNGDEYAKNIGAGAAIGGLMGAAYGVALEYKGLAEIHNNRVCLNIPTLSISSNAHTNDTMVRTNLIQVHF